MMKDLPSDTALGIMVTFEPGLTRRHRHSIFVGPAHSPESPELMAAALNSGRWELMPDLGMLPKWVFAHDASDPLRVAEFRFGVMVLHVFTTLEDRDTHLADQSLNLFEDLTTHVESKMPDHAKYAPLHDFTAAPSGDPDSPTSP